MSLSISKTYSVSVFLLLVALALSVYMLTFRAVIQSGDTLRALDAVSSQARHGDWLMDESNWFKPALIIREESELPLREYDVEERLNARLAALLLRLADSLPRLGNIHTVWLFNVFVTSLSVGLIFCLVRALRFSDAAAVIVALSAGLGTNLWAYSQTFFREPLSAFFILAALLSLRLGQDRKPIARLLSLGVAAAGLYLAYLTKHSALFAIPAALIFALPADYDTGRLPARRLVLWLLTLAGASIALLMILDPLPQLLGQVLVQFGVRTDYAGGALRSYLLSPGASIWGTSPILLLGVAGSLMLWRQRQYALVLTVATGLAGYVVGHALTTGVHWFGGLSWPPRFLLPVLPILMLATAPLAERMLQPGQSRLRLLWAVLLLYGVWIQFSAVSLSWSHYSDSLPAESQGLAEWLPSMYQPQYFRWVLLPQRWGDLGFDFLWTRAQTPIWGFSFAALALAVAWTLIRLLRHNRSRWRYASPLLTIFCFNLILLNLSAAYDRDPRAQSAQAALHEARDYLADAAQPGDILLLPSNDYGNFILNHFDGAWPRVIVLPRPLAQAASDKQPAQVVSNNPNSWFDVGSLRVIHALAGKHDRLWVLDNTSPFMSWSFRPLERYLALHYYLVQDVQLTTPDDAVRLLEYDTSAKAPDPMTLYFGEAAADLLYGDSIRLVSYVLPKGKQYEPGEAIPFSLLWQAETALDQDFTVASFLAEAASGGPVAQGYDSGPQGGFAETSKWAPGIPVWDNRAIRIPAHTQPGDYRLWAVMYRIDSASGNINRLPVRGAEVTGDGTVGVLPFVLNIR